MKPIDFQKLFEEAPGLYLILTPALKIVTASNAYLAATMTKRTEIAGRELFDVFPDNPDDTSADGVSNLRYSLNMVVSTRIENKMAVQKYDIRRPDGSFESRYWSPFNKPVLNDKGAISYIIHRVEDVTAMLALENEQIKKTKEIEEANTSLLKEIAERKKAEERLKESEQIFTDFFYKSPVMQVVSEMSTGKTIEVNGAYASFLGLTKEEMIGKTAKELNIAPAYDREKVMEKIRQDGFIRGLEAQLIPRKGNPIWVSAGMDIIQMRGKVCLLTASTDISKRKEAEEKIKELNDALELRVQERTAALEKSLKEVFDYKYALDESSIVVITDQHGVISYVNDNACKVSKYKREELIGQDHLILNTGFHSGAFFHSLLSIITAGKTWRGEIKNKAQDSHLYWIDTTIVPFIDTAGKPYQYVAIGTDITARKNAEQEILQLNNELTLSERRFKGIIENSQDVIGLVNKENEVIYRSPAHWRITGWEPGEFEKTFAKERAFELIHPDDRELVSGIVTSSLAQPGKALALRYRFKHKQGHYLWMEDFTTNLLEDESIQCIVTNLHDITERKEADDKILSLNKELAQSERKFRALIENSFDVVAITGSSFKPIYRSPSSLRVTGWTNEERSNMNAVEQTHPDDIDRLKSDMEKVLNSPGVPVSTSFRTRHKDGHYVFMEGMITNMMHNQAIQGIVSNFRDVTETRKVEEKIKESELIYRTIASSIPGAIICLFDADFRYLLIEGDMMEKVGYSKQDFIGKRAQDVLPAERFAIQQPFYQRVFKGESFEAETSRFGYDFINRFVPLKNEKGQVYLAMAVTIDITELKNAQREIVALNMGLEQKVIERTIQLDALNKEMEAFSYSVSHDLRAPLRAIIGFTAILQEEYATKLDAEATRIAGIITKNTLKMGNLIDDLLAFSRLGRQEIDKTSINTQQMVAQIITELDNGTNGSSIDWKLSSLPECYGDYNTLRQVWVNLIANAIKYSGKVARRQIEIGSGASPSRDQLVFFVRDNGAGFNEDYKDKLFRVFQRLHAASEFEGTGVGLAIVEKIIIRHHGRVWAEGEVGKGACFYFSLPVQQKIFHQPVKNNK